MKRELWLSLRHIVERVIATVVALWIARRIIGL